MPKVSILMPVWNQEKLVIRALDSIPARDDIEVIVVEDCSTDSTYEVLKNYNRIPIKLFHNEVNRGAGYSRNVCLDNATGDYVYGLDSDDYLDTEKFSWFLDNAPFYKFDILNVWIKLNSGEMWGPGCVGMPTKFVKSSLYEGIRCPETNWAEDAEVYYKIKRTRHPSEIMMDKSLCFYNYNYPRIGSLDNLKQKEVKH